MRRPAQNGPHMRLILLISVFTIVATAPSRAQMQLPGAVGTPTAAGQSLTPPRPRSASSPSGATYSGHFTPARPPGVDSVLGKALSLSGARGELTIEKSGSDLRILRLTAIGDKISRPNQSCEVSMGAEGPINLKSLGAPDGVLRFELDSSACPLQFDVLSGALRARSLSGACSFEQADCRIDASGLWGPAGSSFSETQVKSIEKERGGLENAVRAHFRTLLSKYKKDRPAAEAAIKDQAGFSSERSQICRDYDREEAVGFCALRLTEARDFLLQARLAGEGDKAGPEPSKKRPKPHPAAKPAAIPQAAAPAPAM
jgi:hypothetical protein